MKKYTFSTLILLFMSFSLPSYAQTAGEVWWTEGIGNLFLCVIGGILLAFAFQFLLANLAVAVGISAIGDLRDKGKESAPSSSDEGDSDPTPTGVKISTGFGIFLTVSMAISLFLASLIAVKLSMTPSNLVGYTLGLVIWGGYLLLAIYLDSKMISSLTGSIFSSVKGILGSGVSAIGDMVGPSKTVQMKEAGRETVKAIHDEIRQEYDLSGIQDKLDEYINKLQPREINMDNIQERIAQLLHEIEVKEKYTPDDPEATKHLFLEIASKQPSLSEKDKEKLKNVFDQVKQISKSEGSRSEKVMTAIDKFTPGDEEEGRKYREKVEQYLRKANVEELDPDRLKEDLDNILNNPKAAVDVIRARASRIDRSTIKALITAKKGISEQKAEQYLSKAEEFLESIKSKASGAKDSFEGNSKKLDATEDEMQGRKAGAEQKIKDWFDRMHRPEFQYDRLKLDAQRILDDPKAAPTILKRRLERMDRNSFITLVSNNQKISREQAEKVADKLDEARSEVLNKINEIEEKIKLKAKEIKEEALRQMEGARKTAAAAAWWIFIAATVSGLASALGGITAL